MAVNSFNALPKAKKAFGGVYTEDGQKYGNTS
jgi:hypothetical protein